MPPHISLSTYILHVILVVQPVLLVAVHPEEELGGAVAHLAIAVVELWRQQRGGAWPQLPHRGHPQQLGQLLRAAVIQRFRPPGQRGPAQCAGFGIVGVIVSAAFPLSRQQRFPFSRLVLLLEAGSPAQAVPAGAAAAPGAARAPVGAWGAAEAGLGEKAGVGREVFARKKLKVFCPERWKS